MRLCISACCLWFVFWTCAYVVGRRISEDAPPPSLALSLQENPYLGPFLAAAALLAAIWVVSGFRSR